jgi:homoserine kinase type II
VSVFTAVSSEELSVWLADFDVGTLTELKGIAAGIENTNYFVTTTRGRYVLTLFERLSASEASYYLDLMSYLSAHGVPCPAPAPDRSGALLHTLNGKPATLVSRLAGSDTRSPSPAQCLLVGTELARMHLAGAGFGNHLPHPRGPDWWVKTAPKVDPFLSPEDAELLDNELAFQLTKRLDDLPRGVVHADLFRDNVLFDGERIGGFIDFYFAGEDLLLFDVAVTANDWCVMADGTFDIDRLTPFLAAYAAVRPYTKAERAAWQTMTRAAALRFWLSRLYDFHLPRAGELVHAHDPQQFRQILQSRIASCPPLAQQ